MPPEPGTVVNIAGRYFRKRAVSKIFYSCFLIWGKQPTLCEKTQVRRRKITSENMDSDVDFNFFLEGIFS
jgi:hypothetical protein